MMIKDGRKRVKETRTWSRVAILTEGRGQKTRSRSLGAGNANGVHPVNNVSSVVVLWCGGEKERGRLVLLACHRVQSTNLGIPLSRVFRVRPPVRDHPSREYDVISHPLINEIDRRTNRSIDAMAKS